MNAKISVIVPIYKVENELPRCIESIQNQTYDNLEIILVDDGSPDNCPEICEKYRVQDGRIQVIHKKNGGLSDARNEGLKRASGEFVLYVDSDDYIEKDACEALMAGMIDETVDIVAGALREINGDRFFTQAHSNIQQGVKITAKKFILQSIAANEWYAPAVLNLYRRDFLLKNDLFFKNGRYYEDMEMLPRLFLAAENIVYVNREFYNYVVRSNSIMTSAIGRKKTDDAISNYRDWKARFDEVEDDLLRTYLYAFLIRCYLKTCRTHKIKEWLVEGMDEKFAIKNALGIKEKLKVMLFELAPSIYVKMR